MSGWMDLNPVVTAPESMKMMRLHHNQEAKVVVWRRRTLRQWSQWCKRMYVLDAEFDWCFPIDYFVINYINWFFYWLLHFPPSSRFFGIFNRVFLLALFHVSKSSLVLHLLLYENDWPCLFLFTICLMFQISWLIFVGSLSNCFVLLRRRGI